MLIKSAGNTDIGLVRQLNEDSFRIWEDQNLYIVCDGMGGHSAGEVASQTACDLISGLYKNNFDQLLQDERLHLPRIFPSSTDVLIKSVRIANHRIFTKALQDPAMAGMGTTIVATAIEEDIITLLHVGDSRIYRFYNDRLIPLTTDHSWAAELEETEEITAEEAKQRVNRNVITRALGIKRAVDIDVAVRRLIEGDLYIICSDGLCGLVDDPNIEQVVAGCNRDIDKIVEQLIELANSWGGTDNVSVIALRIDGKTTDSQLSEMNTITVDAESEDYFEAEEEWAEKVEEATKNEENSPGETQTSMLPMLATFIGLVFIALIFYLIFKG